MRHRRIIITTLVIYFNRLLKCVTILQILSQISNVKLDLSVNVDIKSYKRLKFETQFLLMWVAFCPLLEGAVVKTIYNLMLINFNEEYFYIYMLCFYVIYFPMTISFTLKTIHSYCIYTKWKFGDWNGNQQRTRLYLVYRISPLGSIIRVLQAQVLFPSTINISSLEKIK